MKDELEELEYELQAQQEELDFLLGELEWSKDKRKVWEAVTESQRLIEKLEWDLLEEGDAK